MERRSFIGGMTALLGALGMSRELPALEKKVEAVSRIPLDKWQEVPFCLTDEELDAAGLTGVPGSPPFTNRYDALAYLDGIKIGDVYSVTVKGHQSYHRYDEGFSVPALKSTSFEIDAYLNRDAIPFELGGRHNLRIETPYCTIESDVFIQGYRMNTTIDSLLTMHLEMLGTGKPTYVDKTYVFNPRLVKTLFEKQ